jgi:hypothetical protein
MLGRGTTAISSNNNRVTVWSCIPEVDTVYWSAVQGTTLFDCKMFQGGQGGIYPDCDVETICLVVTQQACGGFF